MLFTFLFLPSLLYNKFYLVYLNRPLDSRVKKLNCHFLQVIHCRGYLKVKHQSIGGDLAGSFEPGYQVEI